MYFLVSSMITPTIQKFFTPEERFQQTIKTAESIRKYCENSYCILIEGSVLNKEKCDILQSYFDIILNYGNTPDIIPFVSNINVGCGEQKLLEKGIEYIEEYLFDKIETEYIIKLGGRYELNNNFDINKFDKNKYNFYEEFDNNGNSLNVYTTGLYSIPVYDISFFKNKLKEAADFLSKEWKRPVTLEEAEKINKKYFHINPKIIQRVQILVIYGINALLFAMCLHIV